MPGKVRWIYVEPDSTESDPINHGTCVLAWAVSPVYGTAKKADVVIVQLPFYYEEDEGQWLTTRGGILAALQMVADDIGKKTLDGKAVVNLSWASK
jgi:hypothetical protein